jgi:hypothetical protein
MSNTSDQMTGGARKENRQRRGNSGWATSAWRVIRARNRETRAAAIHIRTPDIRNRGSKTPAESPRHGRAQRPPDPPPTRPLLGSLCGRLGGAEHGRSPRVGIRGLLTRQSSVSLRHMGRWWGYSAWARVRDLSSAYTALPRMIGIASASSGMPVFLKQRERGESRRDTPPELIQPGVGEPTADGRFPSRVPPRLDDARDQERAAPSRQSREHRRFPVSAPKCSSSWAAGPPAGTRTRTSAGSSGRSCIAASACSHSPLVSDPSKD